MPENTLILTESSTHIPVTNSHTASSIPAYRAVPERKPKCSAEKYSWIMSEVPMGDSSFTKPEKMKVRPKTSLQMARRNLI